MYCLNSPYLIFNFLQLIFLLNLINCQQQQSKQFQSFANTKFELSLDLPEEEKEENQINLTETTQSPPPPPPPQETTTTTILISSSIETTTPPQQQTQPPTQQPPQIINQTSSINKTPLPILPNLVQLPKFIERGNVQPITVPPSLVENNEERNNNPNLVINPTTTTTIISLKPINNFNKNNKTFGGILDQKWQSWFRQDFDLTNCPKGADTMAKSFKLKFPPNLLKNKKEKILAELLAIRLRECLKKQRINYWIRMEKKLTKYEEEENRENNGEDENNQRAPDFDRTECREGLVQEQIACMNVYAFSCQFIQPSFPFRLVPTRIIVQEARLAEDGADKCKKFSSNGINSLFVVERNLIKKRQRTNNDIN